MRRAPGRLLLAVAIFATAGGLAAALDVPPTHGFVTDLAGILTLPERIDLESKLQDYAQGRPAVQIAILIVPKLEQETLEGFAQRVFDTWRIGDARTNNGVLFLISIQDRKVRLHTGYGVAPQLTDAVCGTLIRQVIAPAFKERRFAAGIAAGCAAMVEVLKGKE